MLFPQPETGTTPSTVKAQNPTSINRAVRNSLISVPLNFCYSFSLECPQECDSEPKHMWVFYFTKSWQIALQDDGTASHSSWRCQAFLSPLPHQHLVIWGHSDECRIVYYRWTFVVINESEDLSWYPLEFPLPLCVCVCVCVCVYPSFPCIVSLVVCYVVNVFLTIICALHWLELQPIFELLAHPLVAKLFYIFFCDFVILPSIFRSFIHLDTFV